ncbi:MAG: nuclear transport factor 2 family protein [Solirubrobacteraceae bacterium]
MTLTPSDWIAILQLVARADTCATRRDADGYAALFTDDAVMDGDMGTIHGQSALRDAVARVWAAEPAGTLHLTLNAVIDESGAEPTVESVMLMVRAGTSPTVLGSARVRQTVRQAPDGWRISADDRHHWLIQSLFSARPAPRAARSPATVRGWRTQELQQGENIIAAAQRAGLPWLLLASVAAADRAPVPHFRSKARIEQQLKHAAIPWTVVAPSYFYENALGGRASIGEGRLPIALPADKPLHQVALVNRGALVAAILGRGEEHLGARVEVAADAPTPDAMATATGVRYEQIPLAELRRRGQDLEEMYQFLADEGYRIDTAPLRARSRAPASRTGRATSTGEKRRRRIRAAPNAHTAARLLSSTPSIWRPFVATLPPALSTRVPPPRSRLQPQRRLAGASSPIVVHHRPHQRPARTSPQARLG